MISSEPPPSTQYITSIICWQLWPVVSSNSDIKESGPGPVFYSFDLCFSSLIECALWPFKLRNQVLSNNFQFKEVLLRDSLSTNRVTVPFISLWLVEAQNPLCPEGGVFKHGFFIKSPPLHLFNSKVHELRSVIFQQSLTKHQILLLSWVLTRDKWLSLWQNSWKRRYFILSKSNKGDYILKYLKGMCMKGSIAVDQYVTEIHHFLISIFYHPS